MIKTIKIGKKSVRLDNNIGWAIIYKDQFGQDIIPTLLPLLSTLISAFAGIVEDTGKAKDISVEDLVKSMADSSVISKLYGLEFTDFLYITWSLAKCADDDIPEPIPWLRELGDFPLDVIVPAVADLVVKGVVSSKNLKRLEGLKVKLQPIASNLMTSSSQDSNED